MLQFAQGADDVAFEVGGGLGRVAVGAAQRLGDDVVDDVEGLEVRAVSFMASAASGALSPGPPQDGGAAFGA